jgi:hypothetical protein
MKVHIYQEFKRMSEALDFKLRTLIAYDPMGYDTSLRVYEKDGKVIVSGSRYASAD